MSCEEKGRLLLYQYGGGAFLGGGVPAGSRHKGWVDYSDRPVATILTDRRHFLEVSLLEECKRGLTFYEYSGGRCERMQHAVRAGSGWKGWTDYSERPCKTITTGIPHYVEAEMYENKTQIRKDTSGWDDYQFDGRPAPTIVVGAGGAASYHYQVHRTIDQEPGQMHATTGKPPYRVPSMPAIRALPPNGYTVASTFSGSGGSSLGYKMAGFDVRYAAEFIPAAQDTYRANFPGTHLDPRDVRQIKAGDVLRACGLRVGELDVLDGSPPCASFSTSGKREGGWGDVKPYSDTFQRTDDLFFEYSRLVRGVRPRAFVAENVSGLVKGAARGMFLEFLDELKGCGYRVQARLLDARWLGVPQVRQRIIFVGVREDVVDRRGRPVEPAHPLPLPYQYTVRDAIPWVRKIPETTMFASKDEMRSADAPQATMLATSSANRRYVEAEETFPGPLPLPDEDLAALSISKYAIGAEWDKIDPGQSSDKYFNLTKPHGDQPAPTCTALSGVMSAAGIVHPVHRRKLSIGELKRLCSFPDDFVLTGSYEQQWERCGRAVPPVMMKHIAEAVRDEILLVADGRPPARQGLLR